MPNIWQALALAFPLFGGIFWLARLEAKANGANEKYTRILTQLDALEKKLDDFKDTILSSYLDGGRHPGIRS